MKFLLKSEFRIPLRVAFFVGIGIPLLYVNKLGIFTSLCFSLASLILFCVFVIIPHNLEQEYTRLKGENAPLWIYQRIYLDKKREVDAQYAQKVKDWLGFAVFLLVLGIVLYAISH